MPRAKCRQEVAGQTAESSESKEVLKYGESSNGVAEVASVMEKAFYVVAFFYMWRKGSLPGGVAVKIS